MGALDGGWRLAGERFEKPHKPPRKPPKPPRPGPPGSAGLDRIRSSQSAIVKQLDATVFSSKTEPHRSLRRRCYRCDTVVEPRSRTSGFVKMQPARVAASAPEYRKGAFAIIPAAWRATFEQWMENIRDWWKSRHTHPASCGGAPDSGVHLHQVQAPVGRTRGPEGCPKNCRRWVEQVRRAGHLVFSSWRAVREVLGCGPRETRQDLERSIRGHTLVTGPEICSSGGRADADVGCCYHSWITAAIWHRVSARHGSATRSTARVEVVAGQRGSIARSSSCSAHVRALELIAGSRSAQTS